MGEGAVLSVKGGTGLVFSVCLINALYVRSWSSFIALSFIILAFTVLAALSVRTEINPTAVSPSPALFELRYWLSVPSIVPELMDGYKYLLLDLVKMYLGILNCFRLCAFRLDIRPWHRLPGEPVAAPSLAVS